MSAVRDLLKKADRISLFVLSLVLLLILLLTGLILADVSLRQSSEMQGVVDATTSAKIVAQEVALAGERLHEMGTNSIRSGSTGIPRDVLDPGNSYNNSLRAVWLLDTLAESVLDSTWFDGVPHRDVDVSQIKNLAKHVMASRHMQLQGLQGAANDSTGGLALLAEPIVIAGVVTNVGVALIDETSLLVPAGSAAVRGRSFLALLVDGDTVAQLPRVGGWTQRSNRVRVPLPGSPAWFVVSGRSTHQNTIRGAIWIIGSGGLVLLAFGLIRERRQTVRIAERSVELERLSAELLRANRMKSEFLANVSHELRTPLNAIVGFVDLLRDGGYGELSERQQSPVDRVATSAARLRTLVDQVLDVAKIAAGRLDVHAETLALRAFLLNIVNEIEPLVVEKHLTVEVSTVPETLKVRTDPTHLRQIVINLLGNAVKYTDNGQIELRAQGTTTGPPPQNVSATGQHAAFRPDHPSHWVKIDVIDTGLGIATGDLERIFEEFEQVLVPGGQDAGQRGTGLGLPISRRLARVLGGDVSVESTLGQGATFSIWLPVRDEAAR